MPTTLGQRIRISRLNADLTQSALAKHLEVSQALVAHWESGIREPTFEQIYTLASVTHALPAYLFLGDHIPTIDRKANPQAEAWLLKLFRKMTQRQKAQTIQQCQLLLTASSRESTA